MLPRLLTKVLPAPCSVVRRPGAALLSIGKLARGAEGYYLNAVAKGVVDYYLGSGEALGRWIGTGSARLGLHGVVAGDDLRAVLAILWRSFGR